MSTSSGPPGLPKVWTYQRKLSLQMTTAYMKLFELLGVRFLFFYFSVTTELVVLWERVSFLSKVDSEHQKSMWNE